MLELEDYAMVPADELQTGEPFCSLFPIDRNVRASILKSMREAGYDQSKPINVWRQRNVVLDGHTRLGCAIELDTGDVPVCYSDFDTEEEALAYTIANQKNRRSLTNAEFMRCIMAADKRQKHGGDRGNQHTGGKASTEALAEKKSAAVTAKIVGVGRPMVERARAIIDHAEEDPSILQAVLDGKESIRMGAQKVADQRRKKSLLKRMGSPPPRQVVAAPLDAPPLSPSPAAEAVKHNGALESCPLRARVVSHRFDDDVAIHRLAAPVLKQLKVDIRAAVGERSFSAMTPLHRALNYVLDVPGPDYWGVCEKCDGKGRADNLGTCKTCKGGGYLVPGI